MHTAAQEDAGDGKAAQTIRRHPSLTRHGEPRDFHHKLGRVLTDFQNAFHHLVRGSPLAEAVTATVARGGDTDTKGATCGALLGARQGREAVSLQWRNAVLTCRPVAGRGI
jgi:ADP-ribosyl-[dinitrogen reductase] hydrolase